jgi:hypothetical protein
LSEEQFLRTTRDCRCPSGVARVHRGVEQSRRRSMRHELEGPSGVR